ncbi:MAG: hypothetical protein JXB34_09960 [Bacteroidales bacterium]|nr:hypothetical protein [Bacteroidales bacterium]
MDIIFYSANKQSRFSIAIFAVFSVSENIRPGTCNKTKVMNNTTKSLSKSIVFFGDSF